MRSSLLWIAAATLLSSPGGASAADSMTMDCRNPRQGYVAEMDPVARSFSVSAPGGTSRYVVLAIEDTPARLVVAGDVGFKSGLAFAATFRPESKIEFYSNGRLVQTDACRPAK